MMASGATSAPQTEQLDPSIDEHSGGAPLKPTNFLELDQEPLSDGPNEGPPPKLGTLPMPNLWLQKVSPRRPPREDRGLLSKLLEGRGALVIRWPRARA
jgi:hypothetical protein